LDGGLDLGLQMAAAQYVMPICWIASENGWPLILANGSAFMLDPGMGPFLITANHVYDAYCRARAIRPDTVCLLGEIRFPLEDRLIAADPIHDVATFKLLPTEIESLNGLQKFAMTGSQLSWPPKPPQVGRGVFFVGFPGNGRKMRPYAGGGLVEVDWEGYTALAVAAGVSDTGITIILEHDERYDVKGRSKTPPDWALGGCSGAPLLTLVDHAGVLSWRLGGVICESGETIIRVSRADCLNEDGTLNAHPDANAYIAWAEKQRPIDES